MKLSAIQAQFMFSVLGGTLTKSETIGGYSTTTRRMMFDSIMHQQSKKIINLTDNEKIIDLSSEEKKKNK